MSATQTVVLVHRSDNERGQYRTALEALPHVQISGERSDLRSGMALAHQTQPSILVIELAHPIDDTLNAASQFKLEHPDTAIFFATEAFDPDTLLRALRAGASEVLRRPLDRSALSQAVERVAAVSARRHGSSTQRSVLTVFSNKGGAGVSTIATNLALSLRTQTQKEVALVDFDYQSGDVAFLLGISPKQSLGDVLNAPKIDSASVQDALTKHENGVCVLSQPDHLDRVHDVTATQIGSVLEIMASTFDVVVVDAPHLFNDVALEIFDRSSSILMVAEPHIPSVRAAKRSLEIFSKLNFLVVPDRVRLIINRYSDQSSITPQQVEETLGIPVFGKISNDYAAVSQAMNTGRPLCAAAPDSRAGRDIAALAKLLMPGASTNGVAEEVPARRPARLRLFGKG